MHVTTISCTYGRFTKYFTFVVIMTPQFKKGDIFFNYGCLPRTWEDPTFVHPDAEGCRGDNDPVDVCEIGSRIVGTGVSPGLDAGRLTHVPVIFMLILYSPLHRKFGQ